MNSPDPSASGDGQRLRILWALAVALGALAAMQSWSLLGFQPPGLDFLPLWTAGRMAWSAPNEVYDFAAVTHAQAWLLPHFTWMRPYAYPPTALLWLAPLGVLPFWVALGLWLAVSLALFLYAGSRLVGEHRGLALALMALSPTVVLALIAGQSVLLAAGLAVLAFVELPKRPRLAGALLALAVALKPQALLLAPVALIAGGAFEALVSAAVVGAALVVLSAVAFGPSLWAEWFASLPKFQSVVESVPRFTLAMITPTGLARQVGLTGLALTAWQAAFAVVGVVLVWRAFARPASLARRLAALMAGGLFAQPYALCYDGALLVPAAVALAAGEIAGAGWLRRLAALGAVCAVTVPGLGFVAVAAFVGLALLEPVPRPLAQAPHLA